MAGCCSTSIKIKLSLVCLLWCLICAVHRLTPRRASRPSVLIQLSIPHAKRALFIFLCGERILACDLSRALFHVWNLFIIQFIKQPLWHGWVKYDFYFDCNISERLHYIQRAVARIPRIFTHNRMCVLLVGLRAHINNWRSVFARHWMPTGSQLRPLKSLVKLDEWGRRSKKK